MDVYDSRFANTGTVTITSESFPTTNTITYQEYNAIDYVIQTGSGYIYGGTLSGNKPIVVCNGQSVECKDLAEAQAKAEELAHKHGCDAFVLKPVKKVAPKRDVVTTELE
jgi:hypothetical protein